MTIEKTDSFKIDEKNRELQKIARFLGWIWKLNSFIKIHNYIHQQFVNL